MRRQCHEKCNTWFNFSGIDQKDPIVSAALYLNNQARFQQECRVLPHGATVPVPHEHPRCHIYNYSFALHRTRSEWFVHQWGRHVDMAFQLQDGPEGARSIHFRAQLEYPAVPDGSRARVCELSSDTARPFASFTNRSRRLLVTPVTPFLRVLASDPTEGSFGLASRSVHLVWPALCADVQSSTRYRHVLRALKTTSRIRLTWNSIHGRRDCATV